MDSTLICLLDRRRVTQNFVFQLCYRWTVWLLIILSFIVTCRMLLGHSFSCITAGDLPRTFVETTCYADTVYTLPIEQAGNTATGAKTAYRRYQSFYPWVNLFLLVQAFTFYLPYLLWTIYESGYVRRLTAALDNPTSKVSGHNPELCSLAKYVAVSQGKHAMYVALYIFFEVCNCCIALAETLWLVQFFEVTGVPDFLTLSLDTWRDFQQFYFQTSGQCDLELPGVSGSIQLYRMKCSLPLNILYMKLFLLLHTWFIVLTVLTGFVLMYRIASLAPSMRAFVMRVSAPLADRADLMALCFRLSYSDWFFLVHLQKAMPCIDFAQMLDKVSHSTGQQGDDNMSSIVEEIRKELDSSTATSPL